MKKILFILLIILSSCIKEDDLEYREMIFEKVLLTEKIVIMYDPIINQTVFIPYGNDTFGIDIMFLAQIHGNPTFTMIYNKDTNRYYKS